MSVWHNPYHFLWLILAFFSLLIFSSFFFPAREAPTELIFPYAQGYYIRSRATGSIRIIPYAGQAFKSPVSNTIKAVISPYIEEDENKISARQKSESY